MHGATIKMPQDLNCKMHIYSNLISCTMECQVWENLQ